MKHNILILSGLFVAMSVLTSSRENANSCKGLEPLKDEHSCLHPCNEYAINISCGQAPVVQEKSNDTRMEQVIDNELSLSPIGRFILVQ